MKTCSQQQAALGQSPKELRPWTPPLPRIGAHTLGSTSPFHPCLPSPDEEGHVRDEALGRGELSFPRSVSWDPTGPQTCHIQVVLTGPLDLFGSSLALYTDTDLA